MKKLKLNIHTWISGRDYGQSTGYGYAELRNSEGYMCCLGQFAKQLGAKNSDIADRTDPCQMKRVPTLLKDTRWCNKAIDINDGDYISIKDRIDNLKRWCREKGIDHTVVNDSAFRGDGCINWKFVASTCKTLGHEPTSHEIEQHNKYCRQAIRKVGKKKFLENIRKYK